MKANENTVLVGQRVFLVPYQSVALAALVAVTFAAHAFFARCYSRAKHVEVRSFIISAL